MSATAPYDAGVPAPLLALKYAQPTRYPFLLESTAKGSHGRYSILFAFPGETLALSQDFVLRKNGVIHDNADFLTALDVWWERERATVADNADIPFRGGWFVYLGYELASEIEALSTPPGDSSLPVAFATRVPAAIVYDHQHQRTTAVAEPGREDLLDALQADLAHLPEARFSQAIHIDDLTEEPPDTYLESVARARDYIHAGDVFQVNLARAWRGRLSANTSATDIYARLRQTNPAPFSGLAQCGAGTIVSSSPERLVRVKGSRVETRPIAGTRPRHADHEQDAALARQLMSHPKERAEHVMLIDLERNDLGRIAQTGSVHVDELMVTESYARVHHIVSNICATKKPEATPGDVIRAVFPGGTITGCPKVRCMEIIAELEGNRRGPYTGAMGYLNRDGDMDLNILIRTLVVERDTFSLHAGAGIVADSVPELELEETRAKARGLLDALK